MNKNLSNYLEKYILEDNPQFAILINGNWGKGKTYFIKQKIEKWKKSTINKGSFIELKPIYISLNGLINVDQINYNIRKQLKPLLYSKGAKVARSVISGLINSTIKIDIDKLGFKDGGIETILDISSLLENNSESIRGIKLLIFDDLERCKIDMVELLGYINHFVEHTRCKVIILANESEINLAEYKIIKEKIIGKTFELKLDIDEVITKISAQNELANILNIVNNNNTILKNIISIRKENNIRILKHALHDFNLFYNDLDSDLKDNNELIKNLFAYFVITYIELSNGNEKIVEFNGFRNLFNTETFDHSDFEEDNYKVLIEKHKLVLPDNILPIQNIKKYIDTGNIDQINELIKNSTFLKKENEKDWEIIFRWYEIEDEDFEKNLKKIENRFINGEIENIGELLHILGLLIEFANDKYDETSLLSSFDKSLNNIIKLSNKEINISNTIRRSFNKEYYSTHNQIFKKACNSLTTIINEHNKNVIIKVIEHAFCNINNSNIDEFFDLIEEYKSNGNESYYLEAIKYLNKPIIEGYISKLTNKSFFKFRFIIPTLQNKDEAGFYKKILKANNKTLPLRGLMQDKLIAGIELQEKKFQ